MSELNTCSFCGAVIKKKNVRQSNGTYEHHWTGCAHVGPLRVTATFAEAYVNDLLGGAARAIRDEIDRDIFLALDTTTTTAWRTIATYPVVYATTNGGYYTLADYPVYT